MTARSHRTTTINHLVHQTTQLASGTGLAVASVLRTATARFAAAAIALAICVPGAAFLLVGSQPMALILPVFLYLAAASLAIAAMARGPQPARVGPCNLVTLTRLLLTSALLAPLIAPARVPAILTVAVVALALDGIDGWLARRYGHESEFGARFDMEVDAAFGLILALNAWRAGTVGPEVLLLGLPRYLFAAAHRFWPWLAQPLPDRFSRKAVCVLQIIALITLQLPMLAGSGATALYLFTLVILVWSFGRDVLWLHAARS